MAAVPLPSTQLDLLDAPLPAVLPPHVADGRRQCSVVWFDRDGTDLPVNTMRESRPGGAARAATWPSTRVIARIRPRRIVCDAIHR